MNHLVFTFITPDRAGIVDTLATIIKQHQGNWQSSSMHHLSGLFAGVVEVGVAAAQLDSLIKAITSVENLNVQVEVATPAALNNQGIGSVVLDITANDRAGIVQDISSLVHRQGGNLIKLVSRQYSAPHSGQIMFKAKTTVTIPEQNIELLINALENLADDLMVDISR